jgi:hypothetical protein
VNVYENSNSQMPFIYRLTSVWGNHEGSMMLWVSILAFFGALVAVFGNNLPAVLKANALAVQAWIAAAFHLFILTTSNPFARIPQAPFEGRDLNPILQDPGLAFHPPLLYLGYVGFSIAFSFAIAYLMRPTLVKDRNTEICAGGSAAENDAAEAVQSDSKIHGANNECGQNFGPDNWEIGSAIKHILSEKYEVRRRADHIYDVRVVLPESSIITSNTGIES